MPLVSMITCPLQYLATLDEMENIGNASARQAQLPGSSNSNGMPLASTDSGTTQESGLLSQQSVGSKPQQKGPRMGYRYHLRKP